MSTESELRKMLEDNGFTHKEKVKSFDWSYVHPEYLVVVYRKKHFFFNYLSKFMRDEVKKSRGTLLNLNKIQKEDLYREVLSNLDYYGTISDSLAFSFRQSGGDFVGISEQVGFSVLSKILKSIITNSGTGEPLAPVNNLSELNIKLYIPIKADVELAFSQITTDQKGHIDTVLDQVEKNMVDGGKSLKSNWRMITEENINIWFK